ncbi:MAG: adenylosuccinate lyase [Candidatus Neomarinimicrobiota bacterium]|nr:MAG: adenylosuccinate lyase [Candidatus Neomarinimicrobiota bacterium]
MGTVAIKLNTISPLDGRYTKDAQKLSDYFSESALIKYRLLVEIEYLIMLGDEKQVLELEPLSISDRSKLRRIYKSFGDDEAKRVKAIETATNHDVKAVEYYIRERLDKMNKKRLFPWVHFAITSEDINNLSYSLMWQNAVLDVYIPDLDSLIKKLKNTSKTYSTTPMLAMTHGQSATPTTFGKELAVFTKRLARQLRQLKSHKLLGKFGGATGTWAAHNVAYPKIDWSGFSRKFIQRMGLEPNLVTTQIEPHDSIVESYHILIRINTILIDLCRDLWSYISRGIIQQKKIPGEVGSSAMPHKINPIHFENAEGNLGIANALLNHLSNKLPISRMQRDLTDSTVLRNQGVAMGHGFIAIKNILKGFRRIAINKNSMARELDDHWEVLAEAVQTILRKTGSPDAYEQLKQLTRGVRITEDALREFVTHLRIPKKDKDLLNQLTPANYIGLAPKLVDQA